MHKKLCVLEIFVNYKHKPGRMYTRIENKIDFSKNNINIKFLLFFLLNKFSFIYRHIFSALKSIIIKSLFV